MIMEVQPVINTRVTLQLRIVTDGREFPVWRLCQSGYRHDGRAYLAI
jgi:hypothetical protein